MIPKYGTENHTHENEMRKKYKQSKDEQLNEKCAELEIMSIPDKADVH